MDGILGGLARGGARYARMLAEIPGFHARARELLGSGGHDDDLTLGQFLDAGGFSRYFRAHFAMPLVAAVWSCPPGTVLRYPARDLFTLPARLTALTIIGAVIWLAGFVFESVGDAQLARFKADPAHRGVIMDRGLWRYTRHPNYFGDAGGERYGQKAATSSRSSGPLLGSVA